MPERTPSAQHHVKPDENGKYRLELDSAQGVVIGDNAQVEQHFHPAEPRRLTISRDEWLTAIYQAGAELRAYPNDIAGVHIERFEVGQIFDWVMQTGTQQQLGMLLDQPGSGKTVVMRDVLERLESANVPVLAVKADTLSGVKSRYDLADRLGLPEPVDECAQCLAGDGPLVVLLDQVDALSLGLSRDQATLDVMLSTLSRLRNLAKVRIVASCRAFDLNNDPRLSTIKIDRTFKLQPLDNSQINQVLQVMGTDPAHLLPAHRALLAIPLHLKLYARVVAGSAGAGVSESFRTLQELYEALWQKLIMSAEPNAPSPTERVAAVYQLVEVMHASRQLSAPLAVLDDRAEAAACLERVGLVRRERGNWLFIHQTLFDYCYARRFVAQGEHLSQRILGGPQGLFERSQMIQVLAYLRGTNEALYRRELADLLFTDGLRVHLRRLLIGWFGALPDPTADELHIARRLMSHADERGLFLQAAGGNVGWFDLLNEQMLPLLMHTSEEKSLGTIAGYLGTLMQARWEVVLKRLHPYLGTNEAWDACIAFCLTRLDNWQSDGAVEFLSDLLRRGRAAGWEDVCLHKLAQSNPAGACRALRVYLDHRLDNLITHEQAPGHITEREPYAAYKTDSSSRLISGQELLRGYAIGRVLELAVTACPEVLIEHLLPWFERAAMSLGEPRGAPGLLPSDQLFSLLWYGDHIREGPAFAQRIAEGLCHLARTKPDSFRVIAVQLSRLESLTIQRVLAQAYLADPKAYAQDIFEYLTVDPRRLNVGEEAESPHYDSCCLYGAAFRHLDAEHRAILERLVLEPQRAWKDYRPRHRAFVQLQFLKSVPLDLMSPATRHRLEELQCLFPGFELQPPRGIQAGLVGPPIAAASQRKMSDGNWLKAMRKYDDSGRQPRHFLKGGVEQLSSSFAECVKDSPERFCRLARRFDETISLHYVTAAISGLAESDAPAEWVFDLVRQSAPRIRGEFRRLVCWALEKRAEAGVPDDLLDLMTDWALHDPDPDDELWRVCPSGASLAYFGGDPHAHGINTNRGAAIRAVSHCAGNRRPPQVERVFRLLGSAANDPSTAVRTCVVESLGPLLNEDDIRTLAIFEQALENHSLLLQTPVVHQFLFWVYSRHFARIRLFIEALVASADDATRQAGARLVCLAAFQYPEASDLEKRVVQGDAFMRRGAAQVYARNIDRPELEMTCQERLRQFMYDPDEQVRIHVSDCYEHLRPEQVDHLRPFIQEFLTSPASLLGAEHLINYLKPLAVDEHDLALAVANRILDLAGNEVVDMRTSQALLERDLVWLPLAVYTHTTDPVVKSQAMDCFERLLLLGSRAAQDAMLDWDRR